MNSIIDVLEKPISDESITQIDYHTYTPYLQTFNNNDEIRISIQNQDLYLHPCESYLYIEGNVIDSTTNAFPSNKFKMKSNIASYLFDEIRYELNGVEVDKTRYLGITTALKNYVSLSPAESAMMLNASWNSGNEIPMEKSNFNFCVPLKSLLGFAEDFTKMVLHCKHELILLRNKSDEDLISFTEDGLTPKLTITNISWRIPHIHLSDSSKLGTMRTIRSGTPLPLAFRSWDCHFNPTLMPGKSHNWNVKLSAIKERPRFILMAFQKANKITHCDVTNMKIHLNSNSYPYDDLNLNFENERFAIVYEMYLQFQKSYYNRGESSSLLSCQDFKKKAPIFVFDVSRQNEGVTGGSIDIKIEFETSKNIPENTTAYCILIHDREIEYTPLSGLVRKIVS